MTTTHQYIEDLGVEAWAALTRCAAADAVAAAERRGMKPRAELAAVAAMSEGELVQRRKRIGPARKRLSPAMLVVEADHLRHAAEGRAREAHQGKLDAEAAASLARAEAEESARAATAAREQARSARVQAAQIERERAAERAAHQRALQQLRGELEQSRADGTAQLAAAREELAAADARAEQRAAERAADRAAHEQALQRVRDEAKQARADAAAEVAATRAWADGQVAAARDAARAEIARAHAAADDEVARRAQGAQAWAVSTQLLAIPVPPLEIRAETVHIENALNALQHIDHVLEVGMADDRESDSALDVDLIDRLVQIVQEHAMYLSNEVRDAPMNSTTQPQGDAAHTYSAAATAAFRALLQRIDTVSRHLRGRDRVPDVQIIYAVTSMLAHPWVEDLRRQAQ